MTKWASILWKIKFSWQIFLCSDFIDAHIATRCPGYAPATYYSIGFLFICQETCTWLYVLDRCGLSNLINYLAWSTISSCLLHVSSLLVSLLDRILSGCLVCTSLNHLSQLSMSEWVKYIATLNAMIPTSIVMPHLHLINLNLATEILTCSYELQDLGVQSCSQQDTPFP